jgi:DNA-binding MarR family transcriptional regulator
MVILMNEPKSTEERLFELFKRLSCLPQVDSLSDVIQVSPAQVALLRWIARSPGCGVLDIANGLNLSPPTISVGIHKLIKKNLVENKRDKKDRRARPLYLTPDGEALITKFREYRYKMAQRFLSGLTSEEQGQLLSLLERAVQVIEDEQEMRI